MGNKAPITRAVCWKCGTQVPLRHGGDICPACGARLRSIDYDDAARKTATLRIDREKRLNALDVDRLEAEADNARWGVLRKLPFLPSRRWLKAIERERAAVLDEIHNLAARSRELASARYYMGSWYRATGMYLRCDAPSSDGFQRNPLEAAYYDSKGAFHIKKKLRSKEMRGVFGEYLVFELLSLALERDEGISGHLLRSLYIPDVSSCERDPYGATYTEEIDLLLATARALYVIEVKNLRGPIAVRPQKFRDRYEVEVTSPNGSNGVPGVGRYYDRGPSQNHRHVCALRHSLEGRVPGEAIVNLVVYVDNRDGFTMDAPQGLGGAHIATTGAGGHSLLNVIRAIEWSMPVRWDEKGLAELAALLDAEYSDVDGSKAEAHRRAREMHAQAPRPRGTSGRPYRVRSKRGQGRDANQRPARYKRDDELERMMRRLR